MYNIKEYQATSNKQPAQTVVKAHLRLQLEIPKEKIRHFLVFASPVDQEERQLRQPSVTTVTTGASAILHLRFRGLECFFFTKCEQGHEMGLVKAGEASSEEAGRVSLSMELLYACRPFSVST